MESRDIQPVLASLALDLPVRGLLFYARRCGPSWKMTRLVGDVEGVLGRSPDGLLGHGDAWVEALHEADRERVLEEIESMVLGEERVLTYRVITSDGASRAVRDTVRRTGIRWRETVGVIWDDSRQEELRGQVAALEERIARSQRMDSLGTLAAGVAHDFNNLLTTILASVQLVESETDLPAESREDLTLVKEAARRGSRMVRQILRFAREGDHFQGADIELGSTLEELDPILRRTVGPGIRFHFSRDDEMPIVHCDPGQIEQIVLNLVVNARDAMSSSGRIHLSACSEEVADPGPCVVGALREGPYVVIRVRDTGPGIPEDRWESIFEPSFTTKEEESGAGFGLSTVRRIVRGYGGAITVDSALDRGTEFGIWLPVRPGRSGALPEVASPATSASGGCALVVEDDPVARDALTRQLTRMGYEVLGVGSAKDALQAFDHATPRVDILVTDLVLPDRSGPELANALIRRVPSLPVIYASGYGSYRVADRVSSPTEVFLPKPFSTEELGEAIDRVRRAAAELRGDGDASDDRVRNDGGA